MRGLLNYLGNVNDAPFRLNALVLDDLRQTIPDLQQRIMYHYRQEIMRQAFRLMGFADFVGNPVGLFENISSGVMDAFYEPWNGVILNGISKQFGIGVVKVFCRTPFVAVADNNIFRASPVYSKSQSLE